MTMKLKQFQADLTAGKYDEKLCKLYGSSDAVLAAQRARYLQAAENFSCLYPEWEEMPYFLHLAEPRSAETIPITSMAVFWLPLLIWTSLPLWHFTTSM